MRKISINLPLTIDGNRFVIYHLSNRKHARPRLDFGKQKTSNFKESNKTELNMRHSEAWTKARYLLWVGVLCVGLTACSDDDEPRESGNNPGVITAMGDAALTGYAMSGTVSLPIKAEHPDATLSSEKFRYRNISISYDEPIGSEAAIQSSLKQPSMSVVKQDGTDNYVLEFTYNYKEYASCQVSFTLGYEGTDTAIPVSIDIEDVLRKVTVGHLGAGLSEQLEWNLNPEPGIPYVCKLISLKATGEHAENISFKTMDDGTGSPIEYVVRLDNSFKFTPDETAQGHASIPVQTEWECDNGDKFLFYDTLDVCPSCTVEQTVIGKEEVRHTWEVPEEAEALGMDKDEYGNILLRDREKEFYITTKDGCLSPVNDFEYSLYPGVGFKPGSGENEFIPTLALTGLNDLPAGEYIFVAHIKKLLNDPNDRQYVDFHIPFVKE